MKKIYLLLLLAGAFTSCKKDTDVTPAETPEHNHCFQDDDFCNWYNGLGQQTMHELEVAREATERYKDLNNAITDGYVDISVDVEHMGHHYLKSNLVDSTFDVAHPEILVYNRTHDSIPYLVAVEYAVPIGLPEPAGFSGSNDVWNPSQQFQLWLLHAWVWQYNPDGVFNPTNPDVHMH